ncbi:MAG: hypothetical protein IT493_11945 [Gammaproteobacteria bacterium]|nr:hypothetical protein [Gammaproteobacteria bacterium]
MASETDNDGGGGVSSGLSAALAALMNQVTARPSNIYPSPSNAGMFASPRSPYNSFSDQLYDAMMFSGLLSGGPTNPLGGNAAARYDFQSAQPMVGGGMYGTQAYARAFPGFNPYAGRGNTPGGGLLGGGPPGTVGSLAPGVHPPRTLPPSTGVHPFAPPGTQPGAPPTQPGMPSFQPFQPTNPGTHPFAPAAGGPPRTTSTQPPNPRSAAAPPTPQGGLLGTTMVDPRTGQMLFGGKNYSEDPMGNYRSIEQRTIPGAPGDMNVNQFADYIMSLPEGQRINAFNAFLQYKPDLGNGQWLGSYLDSAMRMRMGDAAFSRFAGQQGNQTVASWEGVPEWLKSAITAPQGPQVSVATSYKTLPDGTRYGVNSQGVPILPEGMDLDTFFRMLSGG